MTIKIIKGNILDYDNDIIVQQVNCKGVMGAGLAKQIMDMYPEVPIEYKNFVVKKMKTLKDTSQLLGETLFVDVYDGKIIANIFGQNNIRTDYMDKTVYTNTEALVEGFKNVKKKAQELGMSVGIPTYIGCGLAGGDWHKIKPLIEDLFEGTNIDVNFYHYR